MRIFVVWVGLSIAACGQGRDQPEVAAPVGPTVEALNAARAGVKASLPWADAASKLATALGPPMRIEGGTHGWYVPAKGRCHILELERNADEEVGAVSFGSYDASTPAQFGKCRGKRAVAAGGE
jgi:hypothetical protein